MTAFHTIAIPHDDILQGRLTMDVFAADLWEVFKGRGDPVLQIQTPFGGGKTHALIAMYHKAAE